MDINTSKLLLLKGSEAARTAKIGTVEPDAPSTKISAQESAAPKK